MLWKLSIELWEELNNLEQFISAFKIKTDQPHDFVIANIWFKLNSKAKLLNLHPVPTMGTVKKAIKIIW